MRSNKIIIVSAIFVGLFFGTFKNARASIDDIYLAHPYCCNKFFICVYGAPNERMCQGGLHWNNTLKVCDFPVTAGCRAWGGDTTYCNTPGTSSTDLVLCPPPDENPDDPPGGDKPQCTCSDYNATTATLDIAGGRRVTTTTQRACSELSTCTCYGVTCSNRISYQCECNSGYNAQNQGQSSCNCMRCPTGSYVAGPMAAPYCELCPIHTDLSHPDGTTARGQTSNDNVSTSPTSCWFPATNSFGNNTGVYQFTSACTYSI